MIHILVCVQILCAAMALHKKNLKEVRDFLYDVRLKWYDLGLEVGVEVEDLDEIETTQKDPGVCLREVLKKRLKLVDPLTWKTIGEALRAKAIDVPKLAEKGK